MMDVIILIILFAFLAGNMFRLARDVSMGLVGILWPVFVGAGFIIIGLFYVGLVLDVDKRIAW